MISYRDLLKLLLPEFLVEHFDIIEEEQQQNKEHHIFFEEKIHPHKFSDRLLRSKALYLQSPLLIIPCVVKL